MQESSQTDSNEFVILIGFTVIIVASVVARFFRLGSRELWLDETYSALLANMPLKQALRYNMGDVHPPLFYVLLWSWVRLAGASEAALRLFSVVLFSLGTLGFFFVVRKWLGSYSAAFATLLFTLSPILFVYSLEIRMYMLLVCVVIAVLSVHRVATSETKLSWLFLVLYSVVAALLYYTHYVGVFLLAAFFLDWLILTRFRPDRLLRLCVAGLLTLALTAPWMLVMFHQRSQKLSETRALAASYEDPTALTFREAPPKPTFRGQLPAYVNSGGAAIGLYPSRSSLVLMGLALPIVLVLLGVLYLAATGDRVCRLFVIVSVVLFAGILFLGLTQTRYFLPLLPLLFLAMARALQAYESSRLDQIAKAVGALVLVIYAAGFVRQVTMAHARPWSQLVASLGRSYRPHDIVLFDVIYGQVIFDYYAHEAAFQPQEVGFPESVYTWWQKQAFKGWGGPVLHASDLDTVAAAVTKNPRPLTVWLVLYELNYYDPKDALLARLSQLGRTIELETPPMSNVASSDTRGEQPRLVAISIP